VSIGENEALGSISDLSWILNEIDAVHSIFEQGLVKMIMEGQTVNSEENIPFHEINFNTSRLYGPGQMDAILRGYAQESCRRTDRYFTAQVRSTYNRLGSSSKITTRFANLG
jgi:hypothetical protein